jgi:hypothetical protein
MNGFSLKLMTLVFCLGAASAAWAQMNRPGRQGIGQGNPLMRLQAAIQRSGAPALTSDQQTDLQALIQNYQSAQRSAGPNSEVQSARQNFQNAVLSGDASNAAAAADALAGAMATSLPKRLEALADFEVKALGILQRQGQASILQQQLGNDRFMALLESLAGGPGMMAGMGGFGR